MKEQTITRAQFQHLQGFYFAMYCHYVEGIKTNFGHWANLLDDRGISWNIQNHVAAWAEEKENNRFYLSTLLKNKLNVIVSEL
jgi:hypothetical protein